MQPPIPRSEANKVSKITQKNIDAGFENKWHIKTRSFIQKTRHNFVFLKNIYTNTITMLVPVIQVS